MYYQLWKRYLVTHVTNYLKEYIIIWIVLILIYSKKNYLVLITWNAYPSNYSKLMKHRLI